MAQRKLKIAVPDDCMPKCATCAFAELETPVGIGVCHRYPPIFVADADSADFTFPGVAGQDWCGEYRRKVNA